MRAVSIKISRFVVMPHVATATKKKLCVVRTHHLRLVDSVKLNIFSMAFIYLSNIAFRISRLTLSLWILLHDVVIQNVHAARVSFWSGSFHAMPTELCEIEWQSTAPTSQSFEPMNVWPQESKVLWKQLILIKMTKPHEWVRRTGFLIRPITFGRMYSNEFPLDPTLSP